MTQIKNKQAYYLAMAEIESLLAKGFDNLTEAEDARLDELSDAVEAWESKEYPMPLQSDFKDILFYVMEIKGYNQTQLSSELEISNSLLSEILRGKKLPNVDILLNMHKKFQLDGNVLLESIHR